MTDAVAFLEWLRPGGPWVLTAIVPDGVTQTITAKTAQDVENFVARYNGKRNLYYSVNPTRAAMSKKAAKTDIAAIEFALGDLDPKEGETPEQAKARYLKQFNGGSFKPRPSALVDSGGGLQTLWKLKDRIALGQPVRNDGELKFSDADQATIADVEARVATMMERLGSKAGTQNIDRILRLPGTINVPNAKKRRDGRVPCEAKLVWVYKTAYPLSAFPPPKVEAKGTASSSSSNKSKTTVAAGTGDILEELIHSGGNAPIGKRSEVVWRVVNEMLRRGYSDKTIVATLVDPNNGISAHVRDQKTPEDYAKRQIAHALNKLDFQRDEKGKTVPNDTNIIIGLRLLGVSVRHDQFADRIMLDGLPGFGAALQDAAVNRIWFMFGQRFQWKPVLEVLRLVMADVARLNSFHPVRDYLDGLRWDGQPRVSRWLTTYAGAEDTEYVRAVAALKLIAAVRRVRQPGCKFDEMLVIEQPLQGTDKSSALAVLAVNEDWFTDDLPLHADSKRVIEALAGRWIVEAAELSGMRKADAEHLKALLSRRIDRARMAYGRLPVEAPRQCVFFGTTNREMYLRDTTGNRRFWPVLVQRFYLDALKRDRDQLWAEAVVREANGESIRLERRLWPAAAQEQQRRLADDPYVAILHEYLGHLEGKIKAVDVWAILDLRGAQLTQEANVRMAEAMKRIGWERPNKSRTLRFPGGNQPVSAFVRGDRSKIVSATRDRTIGLEIMCLTEEEAAKRFGREV
jgi:predicted P-loop ATPase